MSSKEQERKKKKKQQQSIIEKELFHFMSGVLEKTMKAALDDLFKSFK